jgi:hypothetical protein
VPDGPAEPCSALPGWRIYMMKKRYLLAFALVLLSVPLVSAEIVDISTYVINLEEYNILTGTYLLEFFITLHCDYDCSIDDFVFINGKADDIIVLDDKSGEKSYRVRAYLENDIDLHAYPFDSQEVTVELEHKRLPSDRLRIRPASQLTGVDDRATIPGWRIAGWDAVEVVRPYPVYNEAYSRYEFSLFLAREKLDSFIKDFIPLFFLIMILLFTFILGIDRIELRIATVSSVLLTAMVYHLTIASRLPPLGYLTFADKFMMLTYFVSVVAIIVDVVELRLLQLKERKLVHRIDRQAAYIFLSIVPLLYILLFVFFI